jgi:succinate dehydrogenase / fumarate reductase flavoprotein subunit
MDFRDAIKGQGADTIKSKYGNLFDMYEEITGESPYQQPFRIYPAVHYCMGGLWVDYNLQTTIPGLYAIGEANFSDHGANRLGASSLMQCLADGYFILPQTIGDGLQPLFRDKVTTDHPAFAEAIDEVKGRVNKVMSIQGSSTPLSIHKRLGKTLWNDCGMSRNAGDLQGAIDHIDQLSDEFWNNVHVTGSATDMNQTLERAMRVADFLEVGRLMCRDALERDESCGCHFREEHQTTEGEVKRNDTDFAHTAVWEWAGEGTAHRRNTEKIHFEHIQPATRSYK